MAIRFLIPGKTFIAGEYLALKKGPALVMTTLPAFEVIVKPGSGHLIGIHENSPAGLFKNAYADFFSQFDIQFQNGYSGLGGWGASTAQFLGLYCLKQWQETLAMGMERYLDTNDLLKTYTQFSWNGEGLPPSGADLIAQYKGRLTWFDRGLGLVNETAWPFADLEVVLVQTGHKVPTHEHLRTMNDFSTENLSLIMSDMKDSLKKCQAEQFVQAIKSYSVELAKLKFTTENTLNLIHDLSWIDGVLVAKGCGALGADVVMVITTKNQTGSLKKYLEENNFKYIVATENISSGLQIRIDEYFPMKTSLREATL